MKYAKFLFYLLTLAIGNVYAQSDSLVTAYKKAVLPEDRGKLAYAIASAIPDSKPELYVAYAREGYAAVRQLEVPVKAKLANVIGYYHQQRGAYDSSGYYFNIALAAAKELHSAKLTNMMLGNLGETYSLKGDYPKALKYQLSVLANYEQEKDLENLQRMTIMVGNTYYNMHEYYRALDYYNRIYSSLKNAKTLRSAGLFNSMGLIYGELGDKKKEIDFLQQSLAIKRTIGDSLGVAKTLSNLGKSAIAQGDRTGAERWFNEALSIAKLMGYKEFADEVAQNLAYLQARKGDAATAIQQYKTSLRVAKAAGDLRIQKIALESLVSLFDTLHDYGAAYRYLAEYAKLADTIHSKNYTQEIAEAETKYETQKALREKDKMEYEGRFLSDARNRAVHEKNIAIVIGAIMITAFILIFVLVLRIRSIRAKRKEEQTYTRAIFEGEQAERMRVARDLHDSIGQMLSVVKMRLSTIQELPISKIAESADISMQLVDKTIEEVRGISHNLIPKELSFGIVRGIESMCNKIREAGEMEIQLAISDTVRSRNFNEQFSLSLYRIIQEVLSNMIKHSGASLIRVNMEETGGLIYLQITDNGKGFDASKLNASKGIGWKNIYARINLLNGNLDIKSDRYTGTKIEITIPQ